MAHLSRSRQGDRSFSSGSGTDTIRTLPPVGLRAAAQPVTRRRLLGRVWLLLLAGVVQLALVPPVSARQDRVESLVLRVFPMVNQPARQALPLVDPLLSTAGTVSFQQEDNALVIRDRSSVLEKLQPVLSEFDHPIREVVLELHLLRASRREAGSKPPNASMNPESTAIALPVALLTELSSILSLNSYEPLGSAKLRVKEGQLVISSVGPDYEFSFDVGTVLRSRYLKLADIRVVRIESRATKAPETETEPKQVFRRSLVNLQFERPTFITVSRNANSASGLVMAFLWTPTPGSGVSPALPTTTGNARDKVGGR